MKKELLMVELEGDRFKLNTDKKSIPTDIAEEIVNTVAEELAKLWHSERRNYKTIIFMQTIAVVVLFISVIAMYLK